MTNPKLLVTFYMINKKPSASWQYRGVGSPAATPRAAALVTRKPLVAGGRTRNAPWSLTPLSFALE